MKRQKVRIDGKVIVTRAKTWFNHNGKRHKIADYPVDKDNKSEETSVNGGNITTKITSEIEVPEKLSTPENVKDEEKVKELSDIKVTGATRTKVTYNQDGSFSFEKVDVSDIPKTEPIPEPKNEKPKPGSYTKPREIVPKPDIAAPENILDSVWKRSTVECLVPIGLLLAGFALKKEADPDNAAYGENVRKHGFAGGWLKDGGNNDW